MLCGYHVQYNVVSRKRPEKHRDRHDFAPDAQRAMDAALAEIEKRRRIRKEGLTNETHH